MALQSNFSPLATRVRKTSIRSMRDWNEGICTFEIRMCVRMSPLVSRNDGLSHPKTCSGLLLWEVLWTVVGESAHVKYRVKEYQII